MKQTAALALAVGIGAVGVGTYWLMARDPSPAERASDEQAERATDESATAPALATGGETRAGVQAVASDQPRAGGASPLDEALAQRSHFSRAQSLIELAGRADVETLGELVAEANVLPHSAARRQALDVLLVRLFELDPINAPKRVLDETLAQMSSPLRSERLASIASAWARIAPQDAWRHGARIADSAGRAAYELAVVTGWGLSDPEGAFAGVVSMPAGSRKDQLLRQVAGDLVRVDPSRAVEVVSTASRADRRAMLMNIVTEWSQHDARAAAQWLEANPGKVNRVVAFQIASQYGAQNATEAVAWAQRFDRGGYRSLVGTALSGYADENPQEALRLAMSLDAGAPRGQAIAAVLGAIARRDPAYAMANLDRVPGGQYRAEAVMNIAMQVVRSDPRAAVDWVKSVDDEEARQNGLMSLGQALANSDPETAANLTDDIPGPYRVSWIAAVASAYAQQDPEAAVRWARTYQNDPGYPQVIAQLASRLAMSDPQAAFELAASSPDARQRDQAIASMLSRVAFRSPETAVRWIDRMSDERLRVQAIGNVAAQWAHTDAAAARKWVTSLEHGAARDQGLSMFVSSSSLPLEDASTLLGQIQSQDRRMDAVMSTARRLAKHDLEAARTLIRRHPLDPRRQEQLAEQVREAYGVTW